MYPAPWIAPGSHKLILSKLPAQTVLTIQDKFNTLHFMCHILLQLCFDDVNNFCLCPIKKRDSFYKHLLLPFF